MRAHRIAAVAQALVTDRPGILFSLTVGKGVFQAELGLPARF